MPNCFALTDKTTNEWEALQIVDDKMREAFGEPPSEDSWLYGWYDCIGLSFALGHSEAKIRESWKDFPDLIRVLDWILENYTPDGWAQR